MSWKQMAISAKVLVCIILGVFFVSSCAVMTVDVDVYKGPLANHEDIRTQQVIAMAIGAKPLLVQLRDTMEDCNYPETVSQRRPQFDDRLMDIVDQYMWDRKIELEKGKFDSREGYEKATKNLYLFLMKKDGFEYFLQLKKEWRESFNAGHNAEEISNAKYEMEKRLDIDINILDWYLGNKKNGKDVMEKLKLVLQGEKEKIKLIAVGDLESVQTIGQELDLLFEKEDKFIQVFAEVFDCIKGNLEAKQVVECLQYISDLQQSSDGTNDWISPVLLYEDEAKRVNEILRLYEDLDRDANHMETNQPDFDSVEDVNSWLDYLAGSIDAYQEDLDHFLPNQQRDQQTWELISKPKNYEQILTDNKSELFGKGTTELTESQNVEIEKLVHSIEKLRSSYNKFLLPENRQNRSANEICVAHNELIRAWKNSPLKDSIFATTSTLSSELFGSDHDKYRLDVVKHYLYEESPELFYLDCELPQEKYGALAQYSMLSRYECVLLHSAVLCPDEGNQKRLANRYYFADRVDRIYISYCNSRRSLAYILEDTLGLLKSVQRVNTESPGLDKLEQIETMGLELIVSLIDFRILNEWKGRPSEINNLLGLKAQGQWKLIVESGANNTFDTGLSSDPNLLKSIENVHGELQKNVSNIVYNNVGGEKSWKYLSYSCGLATGNIAPTNLFGSEINLEESDLSYLKKTVERVKSSKLPTQKTGGFSGGRLNDGINTMIVDYLRARYPKQTADNSSNLILKRIKEGPVYFEEELPKEEWFAEERRLMNALARFSQKILFMANNDILFEKSGLGPRSVKAVEVFFGVDSRMVGMAYSRVLQAIGNSIMVHVNELRQLEEYKWEQTSRYRDEKTAFDSVFTKMSSEEFLWKLTYAIEDTAGDESDETEKMEIQQTAKMLQDNIEEIKKVFSKGYIDNPHEGFEKVQEYIHTSTSLQLSDGMTTSTLSRIVMDHQSQFAYFPTIDRKFSNGDDSLTLDKASDVLDQLIAVLRYQLIQAKALYGKDSHQAKNIEDALTTAISQRSDMVYIRPASAYLRTSFPVTSLQRDASLQSTNMLIQQGAKAIPFYDWIVGGENDRDLLLQVDKQFWQNVSRVRVAGSGDTNYVVAKDDIGNWYVKNYSTNPERIIKSMRSLALYAAAPTLGATAVIDEVTNKSSQIVAPLVVESPQALQIKRAEQVFDKETQNQRNGLLGHDVQIKGKADTISLRQKVQESLYDKKGAETQDSLDYKLQQAEEKAWVNWLKSEMDNANQIPDILQAIRRYRRDLIRRVEEISYHADNSEKQQVDDCLESVKQIIDEYLYGHIHRRRMALMTYEATLKAVSDQSFDSEY